jgi:hypothetical protein
MGAQEKGLNGAGNIVGVEIGRHQADRACVIRRFGRADLSGPSRPVLHLLCNGHVEIQFLKLVNHTAAALHRIVPPVRPDHDVCYDNVATTPM